MRLSSMWAVCWLVACSASCSPSGELAAHPYKSSAQPPPGPFLVKPYLQPGDAPGLVAGGTVQVLWHTEDADAQWAVECRTGADKTWQPAPAPTARRIAVEGVSPHRLYRTSLTGLEPGGEFSYRVRKGGEVVFAADGRGPRPPGKPQRFVVFGDCGANTQEQRTIAFRAYRGSARLRDDHRRHRLRSRPGLRVSREVLAHLQRRRGVARRRGAAACARPSSWPRRATTTSPPATWASIPTAWPISSTGPSRSTGRPARGGARTSPRLGGPEANRKAFLEAAGPNYPADGATSRSTTATSTGRSWTPTPTWTGPIASCGLGSSATWPSAEPAAWRFVAFHQPGFKSSRKHFGEQNMRVMADVFEAGGVDLVFCGHVHNYQRTYPLRFAVERGRDGKPIRNKELVERSLDARPLVRRHHQDPRRGGHLPGHRRGGSAACTIPSSKTTRPRGKNSPTSSSPRSTP